MIHTYKNTLIVGFEYPQPLRRSVWPWLSRHGVLGKVSLDGSAIHENVRPMHRSPYLCARNTAVRDVILKLADKYEWAILINNDITPTESSHKFLELDADLKSCECRLAVPDAFKGENAFHLALSCVRIEVFRQMQPPWFAWTYSDDGCELLECDCQRFARRAMELGFKVAHGGNCSHNHLGAECCPPG